MEYVHGRGRRAGTTTADRETPDSHGAPARAARTRGARRPDAGRAGTWLGQRTGGQVPVAGPAGLGLVSLVTIAVPLPTSRPETEPAAYGTGPDTTPAGS
ncbi:hypothetical protein ACFC09_23870 [Streptomyces sp. NPDC056161]|uniref:hypothetical protein n=1 Tax=Streptomyces sp. NPDC056161 TaxID=3345732 RepID=UPI0035DD0894